MAGKTRAEWGDILWQIFKPALIAAIVATLVMLGRPPAGEMDIQGVSHFSSVYSNDDVQAVDDVIVGDDITLTDDLVMTAGDVTCTNVTASGTVQAEQLTSTDDLTVAGAVTGVTDLTASGTVQAEQLTSTDDLTVAGAGSFGSELTASNGITVSGVITYGNSAMTMSTSGIVAALELEHMVLPTVASAAVTYTSASDIFTVADGEIWIVHNVLINVTTNYDCTGSDCTLQVGDGNDPNGLLDLVDAEIQAADTEGTGWAAGWQGQLAATKGAYLVDSDFVYAPSGSAEGIDLAIGGTDPAAGAATIYIIYTRIQ